MYILHYIYTALHWYTLQHATYYKYGMFNYSTTTLPLHNTDHYTITNYITLHLQLQLQSTYYNYQLHCTNATATRDATRHYNLQLRLNFRDDLQLDLSRKSFSSGTLHYTDYTTLHYTYRRELTTTITLGLNQMYTGHYTTLGYTTLYVLHYMGHNTTVPTDDDHHFSAGVHWNCTTPVMVDKASTAMTKPQFSHMISPWITLSTTTTKSRLVYARKLHTTYCATSTPWHYGQAVMRKLGVPLAAFIAAATGQRKFTTPTTFRWQWVDSALPFVRSESTCLKSQRREENRREEEKISVEKESEERRSMRTAKR